MAPGPPVSPTAITATTSVVAALATLAALLRLYRRATTSRRAPSLPSTYFPQPDDYLFLATLIATWASAAATLVYASSLRRDASADQNDYDPTNLQHAAAVLLAVDVTWAVATGCLRSALAAAAHRLFFVLGRPVTALLRALLAANVAGAAASIAALAYRDAAAVRLLASIADGSDLDRANDDDVTTLSSDIRAARLGTGVACLVLAAASFAATPALIVHWRAAVADFRPKDAGRIALYVMGWASIAFGIARVAMVPSGSGLGVRSRAGAGAGDVYVLLSFLEPGVGLLMACVPSIKKYFTFWKPKLVEPKASREPLRQPRRHLATGDSWDSDHLVDERMSSGADSVRMPVDEQAGHSLDHRGVDMFVAHALTRS